MGGSATWAPSTFWLHSQSADGGGGRQGDGGAASQPYQPRSGTYNWAMFRCKVLGGGNAEKDSSWPCLLMMLPCGRECISAGLLAALLQWHSWTRTWGLIVTLIKHGSVNQAVCKEDILLWKLKLLTTPHAWSTWRAKTSLWKTTLGVLNTNSNM